VKSHAASPSGLHTPVDRPRGEEVSERTTRTVARWAIGHRRDKSLTRPALVADRDRSPDIPLGVRSRAAGVFQSEVRVALRFVGPPRVAPRSRGADVVARQFSDEESAREGDFGSKT